MTLFATLFPLVCWFVYNYGIALLERKRPSLSTIMSMQRRRWVANAVRRESPLDAILSGNIMGSVSFLASTTALLVLAIFTAFGNLNSLMDTLKTVGFRVSFTNSDIEIHLFVVLTIFVLSFFSFTLALRQFNHFCILLGAIDHSGRTSPKRSTPSPSSTHWLPRTSTTASAPTISRCPWCSGSPTSGLP